MKKILSTLCSLTIMATVVSFPLTRAAEITGTVVSFTDVADSAHMEAILELSSRGVVGGYADGTFKPDQTINRAEFLKILTLTKGDYSPATDPSGYDIETPVGLNFSDVRTKQWYVPYVRNAVQLGIINGYPDGTFRPANEINLAEALKTIFLTFKLPTVVFIREPDHWYDYYTTGLDADFESFTSLNATTDIASKITRGEMASLILYFEGKAKLLAGAPGTEGGPSFIEKPIILVKHFLNGGWTLSGYVMFGNSCSKPVTSTTAFPGQTDLISLRIDEVAVTGVDCVSTPMEHAVTFSFNATEMAQIGDVLVNGKPVTTIVHDASLEAGNLYSPLTLQMTESGGMTNLSGSMQVLGCFTAQVNTVVYDGTHQQAELDISLVEKTTSDTRCGHFFSPVAVDVSLPATVKMGTTFRGRINGVPVELSVE